MIRVGVNGYGTIGKRVADAVAAQPDMTLRGVAKRSPNHEAASAVRREHDLFAADPDRTDEFAAAGIPLAGTLSDLLADVDVVVDCCPAGVGAQNKETYEKYGVKMVFQGGESRDLVDASFTARTAFESARNADSVRVVSCNTTGLARLLAPLAETYGVEKARVTLVRRGGDPAQTDRGPINDIVPDPATLPSHHGPDVNTVLSGVDVDTAALKAPVTTMHTHSVNVTLESTPAVDELTELLERETRLFLIPAVADIDGAGKLKEYALDIGRPRGDLWENCVWTESIDISGRDLYLFQNVHQEADVVPENVDAIRAMATEVSADESMAWTNEALGVGIAGQFEAVSTTDSPVAADD
ncbi:MAG: type II glyceraldehyde-3-phosphate dehydrogenase [Halorubrum sp.]